MATFYDMDQILDANRSRGHHFFDWATMRFFRGRLTDNVYPVEGDGALFVHSIRNPDLGPRQYRVAWCHADGTVDNVDDDRTFPVGPTLTLNGLRTLAQAKTYAAQLQVELLTAPPLAWAVCADAGHAGYQEHGVSCYRCCECLSCSIQRRTESR